MPPSSSSYPTRSNSNKLLRSSGSPVATTSSYYYNSIHHHHHHHHHQQHQQQLAALFPSIALCTSCKNSPSAPTLDLFLLLLALSSSAFLIASSCRSLSRLILPYLPSFPPPIAFPDAPLPYIAAGFFLFFAVASLLAGFAGLSCRRPSRRARRCGNPRCRGLKKALEFDVQLQTEDCIRSPPDPAQAAMWREIDDLPWKGGQQGNNPDYECLRAELRKMAPPNGRAVLLFRARCGCPLAKLEAWGPKRGRRHKKSMSLALEGGDQ